MGVLSGSGDLEPTGGGMGESTARSPTRRIYRFGSFELKTETGELSKRGIRLRLQTKPLHILELLLARPGELVTREELCARLWPETYVDFESGLNTAINRLRAALGDSADAPRYIETLPRLGYRFLVPVEVSEEPDRVLAAHALSNPSRMAQNVPEVLDPAPSSPAAPALGLRPFLKPLRVVSVIVIAAASFVTYGFLRSEAKISHLSPAFHQLTFRSGKIVSARFSPDPNKIIYTARWRPDERSTYLLDLKDSSSRVLSFVSGTLEAVSSRGDLLFTSIDARHTNLDSALSRVPISGGSAKLLAEQVNVADFDRAGRRLAIVRENGSASSIEFPPGHTIYKSTGWISSLRVAPCGSIVAFLEHPVSDDDGGHVRIARLDGSSRLMTGEWNSIDGLAWSPSGNEVWFTASKFGDGRSLYAVSEKGSVRRISNSPLALRILDISSSGRALVSLDDYRVTMMAALPGGSAETDLSKFDFSYVEDISRDGSLILFTEGGAAGGRHYTAFVYSQRTHQSTRVGAGRGFAISPDMRSVLMLDPENRGVLTLVPLGPGQPKTIQGEGFQYEWARFAGPDGKKLLVGGSYSGSPAMIGMQLIDNGRPVKLEGIPYMDHVVVSRDGLRLAGLIPSGRPAAADLATGKLLSRIPQSISIPVAWSSDDRSLYMLGLTGSPGDVQRVDLDTGGTALWKSLGPRGVTGFLGLANLVAVPETGTYAYSATWDLSRMYVVDGWS